MKAFLGWRHGFGHTAEAVTSKFGDFGEIATASGTGGTVTDRVFGASGGATSPPGTTATATRPPWRLRHRGSSGRQRTASSTTSVSVHRPRRPVEMSLCSRTSISQARDRHPASSRCRTYRCCSRCSRHRVRSRSKIEFNNCSCRLSGSRSFRPCEGAGL